MTTKKNKPTLAEIRMRNDAVLHQLRLPAAAQAYLQQASEPSVVSMTFDERLYAMLEYEIQQRALKRQKRLLKESGIAGALSSIEDIDFSKERNLNPSLLRDLATCNWLNELSQPAVVVTGATGVGKTLLVKTLGNDIAQLTYMVDKAMEYNYRHVGFILDRGYFSQGNIRYMDENGFPFVIMVKGHKELVRAIVEEKRLSFESKRDGLIDGYYIYSTTVQRRIFESDKTTRFIHLYFNPKKMSAEREQIEIKITRLKEFLKKVENKQVTLGAPFTEYFKLHYDKDGVFLFAEERQEVIERELELAGYFTIISSEKMTAEAAYRLYKGRDVSEKLFRADKTFLGSRSARVHSRKSLATKNLIEFIALIVRNRIYNLLKDETLRVGLKQNFMTVPAAIRELEKIEMVRRNNGFYRLDHAVTRTQRIILSAFGLTAEDIRKKAHEIALKLSENEQTTQPEEKQDDGEDEITDID